MADSEQENLILSSFIPHIMLLCVANNIKYKIYEVAYLNL